MQQGTKTNLKELAVLAYPDQVLMTASMYSVSTQKTEYAEPRMLEFLLSPYSGNYYLQCCKSMPNPPFKFPNKLKISKWS